MSQDKFLTWGSFIGSPDWIKKKKTRINPKNTDDKRFQYVAIIVL